MSVLPAKPEDLTWLVLRTTAALSPDALGLKAVDALGHIQAMTVFDMWTHNAASMHVAIDNPMAGLALLRPSFTFVFETIGRGVVFATVGAHNTKCISLVRRLGFSLAHKTTDGWASGFDLLHFEMRKTACPWISQRQRKAA